MVDKNLYKFSLLQHGDFYQFLVHD